MYVCLYFSSCGASARFRAMASPITFLQPSLVLAATFPSRPVSGANVWRHSQEHNLFYLWASLRY